MEFFGHAELTWPRTVQPSITTEGYRWDMSDLKKSGSLAAGLFPEVRLNKVMIDSISRGYAVVEVAIVLPQKSPNDLTMGRHGLVNPTYTPSKECICSPKEVWNSSWNSITGKLFLSK
jgi:hypothetical protein